MLWMSLLNISSVSASWAYEFVVNDGRSFIVSEEVVKKTLVGDVVGEVTYHSMQEGSYNGNFSNSYPVGTKYYAIQGLLPNEVIAIKSDTGDYLKAIYDGEYGGSDDSIQPKQYSQIAADNGRKDYSIVLLSLLLASFVAMIITISAAVIKNRRV